MVVTEVVFSQVAVQMLFPAMLVDAIRPLEQPEEPLPAEFV